MTEPGRRTLVAMSGGVDSSVAAALVAEAGGEVLGLSMQLYDRDPDGAANLGGCCTPDDLQDARAVAASLGIPHYVMGFQREFRRHVLDYFASEYESGRTPIPCIPCNTALKFGRLLERARLLDAAQVATGHYARVDRPGERYRLRAGVDRARDQSYFLFELSQEQLAAAWFPLGDLRKEEVRDLARRHRLSTADKPESRDLCFVGAGTYRDVLGPGAPGAIVDRSGRHLGTHRGVSGFTVGQRHGIGVASGRRLYVLEVDAARRRVVVGGEEEQYWGALAAGRANWIFHDRPEAPFRATARVRYRHAGAPATVEPGASGRFQVRFDEPQRVLAPGQAVVLYRGDEVLGGGWIERALDPISLTTLRPSGTIAAPERE